MKTYLLKKYPVVKNNEFTQNADLHLIMELIDNLLKEKPKKIINEKNHQETEKGDSSNKNTKNLTPGEINKNNEKDSENKKQVKDNKAKKKNQFKRKSKG